MTDALVNMESSSSSDENNDMTTFSQRPRGRTVKKEFVFLKEKVRSVPRGSVMRTHINEGRVREVAVSPSYTSEQMADHLKANIPSLSSVDFCR